MMTIANDTYNELKKDFPPEALSKDTSRGFELTSIKAQWIKERLNDVLGVTGWTHTGEYQVNDQGVLYLGKLTIYIDGDEVETSFREEAGFSIHKKNLGDTYKSAKTDSLSKCASGFGVGNSVFKGEVKVGAPTTYRKPAAKKSNQTLYQDKKGKNVVGDYDFVNTKWEYEYPAGLKGKVVSEMKPFELLACRDWMHKWSEGKDGYNYLKYIAILSHNYKLVTTKKG